MISIRKITKGNNSAKNVGGVTVISLCMSSGHALYFYQSYGADTNDEPLTDGRTDRHTKFRRV